MSSLTLPRYCHASSSRLTLLHPIPALPLRRRLSLLPPRQSEQLPFFTPPFRPPVNLKPHSLPVGYERGKSKGKEPEPPKMDEQEVDDREWEMRAARAMLHLRDTLPMFFHHGQSTQTLFPPDIFSAHMVLKLPPPLPLKISSLSAYGIAFAIARNGMQALHSELRTSLDRMTYSPTPKDFANNPGEALLLSGKPVPAHRLKQIRVLVSVHGTPRLPPHHEAVWQTSSLYTISPVSGYIVSHEVESIRPLPGEGVAEWLKNRLLGWTNAKHNDEEAIPCPRAVPVPTHAELVRFLQSRRR